MEETNYDVTLEGTEETGVTEVKSGSGLGKVIIGLGAAGVLGIVGFVGYKLNKKRKQKSAADDVVSTDSQEFKEATEVEHMKDCEVEN